MNIRIIFLDCVDPIRSQAIYHGLAYNLSPKDEPILVFLRPNSPYVSIGLHQDITSEINISWCEQNKLPIIRRNVGGGTVLLDQNQLFFQFIFPKLQVPQNPSALYQHLLRPVVQTYRGLGCKNVSQVENDIHVMGKKICGTGAASINNATVLVGNFLYQFDYITMSKCINAPSQNFSVIFTQLMQSHMTTLNEQLAYLPKDMDIVSLLTKYIQTTLQLDAYTDSISPNESFAIEKAETKLRDKEWTYQEGNRLIKNGIKVAAKKYLLEKRFIQNEHHFTLRIFVSKGAIEYVWLENEAIAPAECDLELIRLIKQQKPEIHQLPVTKNSSQTLYSVLEELLNFATY